MDIDGCIEFINFICEECWKWDKERKDDKNENHTMRND